MAVNSKTLASLISSVRANASEPNEAGHATPAEIAEWLNIAQLEAIKVVGKMYKEQTITTVASQADYDLPDDFQDAINVQYQTSSQNRRLKPMTSIQYLSYSIINTTSIPTSYVIIGEKIYIYQTPSTGLQSVSHWYTAYPDELSADADVPFNDIKRYYPYHTLLLDYAIARLKQKEGAYGAEASYMAKWEKGLEIMKTDMARRSKGFQFARWDDQITRMQAPYIPLHI